MQATLPLIALATGAVLPSPLHAVYDALVAGKPGAPGARGTECKITALPARLQEDVRLVGALAELFATAAAERLMNAGLTPGSDEQIYRRPSSQSRRNVMPQVLPLIALAAGVALCSPEVASPAVAQRDRAATRRRHRSRPDQRRIRRPKRR